MTAGGKSSQLENSAIWINRALNEYINPSASKKDASEAFSDVTDQLGSHNASSLNIDTDLTKEIKSLERESDLAKGIKRHEILAINGLAILGHDVNHDLQPVLIRDARDQTGKEFGIDIAEDHKIAMLNRLRGAYKIIDMSSLGAKKQKELKTTLLNKYKKKAKLIGSNEEAISLKDARVQNNNQADLKTLEKANQKSQKRRIEIVRDFEDEIIAELSNQKESMQNLYGAVPSKGKIKNMLMEAMDMANLKEDQPHIITINNTGVEGKFQATASIKCKANSSAQVKDFETISDFDPDNPESIKNMPKWFQKLKPYQRTLVTDNIEELIKGEKTLPTSIRWLPGIRNFWHETTHLINTTDGKQPQTIKLCGFYRHATLAYFSGVKFFSFNTLAKDKTKENTEHLKTITNSIEGTEETTPTNIVLNHHDLGGEQSKILGLLKGASKAASSGYKYVQFALSGFGNVNDKSKFIEQGVKMIEKNTATTIACTSGKDRTGWFSSVIEMVFVSKSLKLTEQTSQKQFSNYVHSAGHQQYLASTNSHGANWLKLDGALWNSALKTYQWVLGDYAEDLKNSKIGIYNKVKGLRESFTKNPLKAMKQWMSSRSNNKEQTVSR